MMGPGFKGAPATGIGFEKETFCRALYNTTMDQIKQAYKSFIDLGVPVEDARGVLPTNIKTNILVSMNLRRIVELCIKRTSPRVQGEYRNFIELLQEEIQGVHPWTKVFFERVGQKLYDELKELLEEELDGPESVFKVFKIIDQMRRQA